MSYKSAKTETTVSRILFYHTIGGSEPPHSIFNLTGKFSAGTLSRTLDFGVFTPPVKKGR